MIAPREAVASIPDGLSATEAAPMMCTGVTAYNALRNSGAREGDVVAIFGVGGLGHLGIQFASKMGFKTIAIGRGKDKAEIVRKLGAIHYIDSRSQNPVDELVKLGGAKIILGTGPGGKALSSLLVRLMKRLNYPRISSSSDIDQSLAGSPDLLSIQKIHSLSVYLQVFDL